MDKLSNISTPPVTTALVTALLVADLTLDGSSNAAAVKHDYVGVT